MIEPTNRERPAPGRRLRFSSGGGRPRTALSGAGLLAGALVLVAGVLTALPAGAQDVMQSPLPDRPEPPPFYAIENARIVTGTGEVLESGTVVLADGLIEAVGTDVEVPPEAWILDGSGLTVYPGLFDGRSELGLRGAEGGEGERGGSGGSPFGGSGERDVASGPEDRPATYPWKAAADELSAEDDRIETWREGGYTNALVTPRDGIVRGQGAVIALAGEPHEMVVAAPAALELSLRSPGGFLSFPGSLFGVMSYLEQLFLDAAHHARAVEAYRENPRGKERPRYDRTLEPIHRAVREEWPVLIPGDGAVEIRRAIDLGRSLGVRTVVVGGHGAWRMADELAAADVPVLVSLDWPERGRDVDPETDESLRSLMERAYAPAVPAALEAAGVVWAFTADDLATPGQALEAVREAIEAGLSEDAALRGLTAGPAEIFGVAARTGTVEAGKIANLTVTDGDLFADGTKVKMTFVDGRKFEIREPFRPQEPPATDLSGIWTLSLETPGGIEEIRADLEMAEDGSLSGTLSGDRGEQAVTGGWVSGERFRITSSFTMGSRTMEVTYNGTVEGDRLEGTASVGGRFSVDFTGERTGPPAGGGR